MVSQIQTIVRESPKHRTVGEVITSLREWEKIHSPMDRGGILSHFQFIIERTTESQVPAGMALVPFAPSSDGSTALSLEKPIYLMPHAGDQLLGRLRYPRDLVGRLPDKLNVWNLNWLIQNEEKDRDICLRIQDQNRARALVSGRYEAIDNLDIIALLEPFTQDAIVRWEHNDELTFNLSVSFPRTQTELRVGDVVEQGIHISNSEVGLKSVTVAAYVLRLKCMNGLIGGGDDGGFYRFRHIGDRNRLTQAVKTAIDDIRMKAEGLVARFKMALNEAIADPAGMLEKMAKDGNLTQDQFKASLDALVGDPDAHTLFGVANSLTSAAKNFDGEASFDLQRLGAKVLAEGGK